MTSSPVFQEGYRAGSDESNQSGRSEDAALRQPRPFTRVGLWRTRTRVSLISFSEWSFSCEHSDRRDSFRLSDESRAALRLHTRRASVEIMPGGGRFSRDGDALSRDWRGRVISDDPWRQTSSPGADGGEAQGYFVTSGPTNAYAKPSKIDTSAQPVPRAAHEKIAADLAHDTAVPLPGAILHRWPTPPAGCDQPCVALSLIPFLAVHKWATVKAVPAIEAQLKLELREAASVLVAFDTWVDNRDRVSDSNLLVSKASADPSAPAQVAYIDYAYSLAHGWRAGGYQNIVACQMFPTDPKDVDTSAMDGAINRIESVPDDAVREVVTRIPRDFLAEADRDLIISGLLHRKTRLRPALKAVYGGLP
jgi:hypothetical protein